jgi:hypothetical protein
MNRLLNFCLDTFEKVRTGDKYLVGFISGLVAEEPGEQLARRATGLHYIAWPDPAPPIKSLAI